MRGPVGRREARVLMAPKRHDVVSVFYPRGLRTGGPEALHQLVDALRSLDVEAVLVPFPGTENAERVPEYSHYDAPEAPSPVDVAGAAVVLPEVLLTQLRVTHAEHYCWWLSIDNSPLFAARRTWQRRQADLPWAKTARLLAGRSKATLRRLSATPAIRETMHLSQSHYAWSFLYADLGVTPTMLSDYTTHQVIDRVPGLNRTPSVAFYPAKGGEHISEVQARLGRDVLWLPLVNLPPEQVQQVLQDADVYLDLGHQPGKDRLPREAAASGAVTLVLRTGAGAFSGDVNIPFEHKIPAEGDIPEAASRTLSRVLEDLPLAHERQRCYREEIADEKRNFFSEVEAIFVEGLMGFDAPPALTERRWK